MRVQGMSIIVLFCYTVLVAHSAFAAKRQPFRLMLTPTSSGTRSTTYELHTSPIEVGAKVTSISGGCCDCATNGTGFVWSCSENCQCSGLHHSFSLVATWEGYSLPFSWSSRCPCQSNTTNEWPNATMPYVGLQFDKAVILFEDEYTNSYGQAIGSRSTTARLTGVVYGGTQGGTYSFELSDGDRLVKIGESETFGVTNIAPNQSHVFWVDYRSAKRSDIKDDISATLIFHPNGGGGDASAVAHLTSVEVSTYVHNSWIPYTSRKELGVGERSNIIIEPIDGIDPIMVAGCTYTNLTWQYRATSEHLTENITVSCSGVDFPVTFQTFLPQSIEAKCVFCDTNTIRNVAGNFVGHFDLAVLPTNVSFQALLIAELGFVSTNAVGFFALPSQSDLLDHSIHGGNTWHGIGAGNVFYDMVAFKAICPPWGEGGSFTWPIENAWRIRFDLPVTNLVPWNASYDQRFELDADGTTRIMKFLYSLQQATNLEFQVTREVR